MLRGRIDQSRRQAVAHLMRVAMRNHDDVARGEGRGLVAHADVAATLGDHVKLDDVARAAGR